MVSPPPGRSCVLRSASCAAAIADDGQTEPVAVRVADAVGGEPPERLEEPVDLVGTAGVATGALATAVYASAKG